jgi:hypothetical protein
LLGGLGEFSLPRRVEECHEGVAEVAAGDDWWDSPNDLLDNQTPTAVLDDAADIDPTANSLEGTIETPSLRSPWDGLGDGGETIPLVEDVLAALSAAPGSSVADEEVDKAMDLVERLEREEGSACGGRIPRPWSSTVSWLSWRRLLRSEVGPDDRDRGRLLGRDGRATDHGGLMVGSLAVTLLATPSV